MFGRGGCGGETNLVTPRIRIARSWSLELAASGHGTIAATGRDTSRTTAPTSMVGVHIRGAFPSILSVHKALTKGIWELYNGIHALHSLETLAEVV